MRIGLQRVWVSEARCRDGERVGRQEDRKDGRKGVRVTEKKRQRAKPDDKGQKIESERTRERGTEPRLDRTRPHRGADRRPHRGLIPDWFPGLPDRNGPGRDETGEGVDRDRCRQTPPDTDRQLATQTERQQESLEGPNALREVESKKRQERKTEDTPRQSDVCACRLRTGHCKLATRCEFRRSAEQALMILRLGAEVQFKCSMAGTDRRSFGSCTGAAAPGSKHGGSVSVQPHSHYATIFAPRLDCLVFSRVAGPDVAAQCGFVPANLESPSDMDCYCRGNTHVPLRPRRSV